MKVITLDFFLFFDLDLWPVYRHTDHELAICIATSISSMQQIVVQSLDERMLCWPHCPGYSSCTSRLLSGLTEVRWGGPGRCGGGAVSRQRDVRLGNWENIDLVYGWEVLGLSAVVMHFNGLRLWKKNKKINQSINPKLSWKCNNNNSHCRKNNIKNHEPDSSAVPAPLAGSLSWLLGVWEVLMAPMGVTPNCLLINCF